MQHYIIFLKFLFVFFILLQASSHAGKHFPISMYPKRKTCTACGYKTDKNGKQSRKKTSNYCEKCDLYICKDCFEKFHTRSKI